jgi:hypothetical protein
MIHKKLLLIFCFIILAAAFMGLTLSGGDGSAAAPGTTQDSEVYSAPARPAPPPPELRTGYPG